MTRKRTEKKEEQAFSVTAIFAAAAKTTTVPEPKGPIPETLREAFDGPDREHWIEAWRTHLSKCHELGVWREEQVPKGRKAIKNGYVFRVKRNAQGEATEYHIRLTVKGYSQVPGRDFTQTSSPVARHASIRLLLSLACSLDLDLFQIDVEAAYLQAPLEEEIWMEQPEGLERHTPGVFLACRLLKAIPGLKQAALVFYRKLKRCLLSLGFRSLQSDKAVFVRHTSTELLVIDGWIDDLGLGASKGANVQGFLSDLNKLLPIKVSLMTHFLGIQVLRDRRKGVLQIGQAAYIESLSRRFDMHASGLVVGGVPTTAAVSSPSTPMESGTVLPLIPADPTPEQLQSSPPSLIAAYRSLLGGLLFIANNTRPDVSYSVSYLARFARLPATTHFRALLRVLAYLFATRYKYLTFTASSSKPTLFCYADATWVGKQGTDELSRSTSGWVCGYGGGLVAWGSNVQKRPALSSTDAEFIAACECARECVALRNELEELGLPEPGPTPLFEDNQGCVETAKNGVCGSGLKHVLLRERYLLWAAEEKLVDVRRVDTDNNIADILTKPLPPTRHINLASRFLSNALILPSSL
jgi:hypothetical protein